MSAVVDSIKILDGTTRTLIKAEAASQDGVLLARSEVTVIGAGVVIR